MDIRTKFAKIALLMVAATMLLVTVGCSGGVDETAGQKNPVTKKKGVKAGTKKDIQFLATE
jgi:hypothetical protein